MSEIIFSESVAVSPVAMYKMQTTGDNPAVSDRQFSTPQIKYELKLTPWAPWGLDNQLPDQMAAKIDKCGILNSSVEAKARIAIGKGIRPVIVTGVSKDGVEEFEFIHDVEIEDWLEMSNDFFNSIRSIENLIGYGWNHCRIIMSNDRKTIARYRNDDVVNCRLGRKNDYGITDKTYIAANWNAIFGLETADKYVKPIICLEENNEYNNLLDQIAAGSTEKEYSIISRSKLNGKNYYPYPLWYSVIDWVELAIKVPEMKKFMFANQMTIKYMIYINEKYFSRNDIKWGSYNAAEKQEKFQAKVADINTHFAGNEKAYKSIGTQFYTDPSSGQIVKDIIIEVLDDKIKDGQLLPDSSAADKQILFSLMMNPAIMGANTGGDYRGGAGSGSDIREAYLVQIMLMESERRMNAKIFNLVKRYNGWDKKYTGKNLQFRYPSLILTTLDTGKSTAPVTN